MKNKNIWLFLILLLGTILRFYHLGAIGLWHDEAFSALLVKYSWGEMLYRIGLDVHPPIYYILLRLWTNLLGNTLFTLRAFSATFGVLSIFMTYKLVQAAFKNEMVALLAALFIATNPFQIQYVTEARMYTLGAFFVLSSGYFLLKALQAQENSLESNTTEHDVSKKTWMYWFLFSIFTSLSLYTHYYLFFSAFGIGLYALYAILSSPLKTKLESYKYIFGAYLFVLISYIPWLKTFFFQFHQVQENYWIEKMNRWSLPQTIWRMFIGTATDHTKSETQKALLLVCLFTLYLLYRVIKKTPQKEKWLVLLGLIIPFIGAALLSLKQSIFLDRYFLFAGIFYVITLAVWIGSIKNKTAQIVLAVLIVGIGLFNYTKNWKEMRIKEHPGMTAAAQYINIKASPQDKIIIATSFEFFNFRYYNQTALHPLLYTPGIKQVNDLPHFSGTALLKDEDLIHNWNDGTHKEQTIWVIWTNGFGGSKPPVPDNWILLRDELMYPDVHPYMGTNIYVDQYRIN